METETDWHDPTHEADNPPARPIFPGRPIDEDAASREHAWSSFDDYAREVPTVPDYVKTAAIAAFAGLSGLAVGYWLGGRRAPRRRKPFSLADTDFSDFAKLAPEVAHLFKNPVVRALTARLVARQIGRYLAA